MLNDLINGDARTQQENTIKFYLNYSRAYYDSFRIKDDRLEIWPILFSIKNLFKDNEITLEVIDVVIRDEYDIDLSSHVIRSRILGLCSNGYVSIEPSVCSVQEMKYNTKITPTEKFFRGFSEHASECVLRLLPSKQQKKYCCDFEDSINSLIHDMVKQHRIEWCLLVRNEIMKYCTIKNVVMASDLRRKITGEDVYWMTVLSAWRNCLESNDNAGFTFDDMNHWLNRRSYVPVEMTRDVLSNLTKKIEFFKKEEHKNYNVYRIHANLISSMVSHSKILENIRQNFDDTCEEIICSRKSLQNAAKILSDCNNSHEDQMILNNKEQKLEGFISQIL